ncbi:MAG: hypothetical protein GX444_11465 [Myxococcales bacterium]|nr:hypothetical protein [Myxococcales bacterium]
MLMNKYPFQPFLFLVMLFSFIACANNDNGGGDVELTTAECSAINKECKAYSMSARDNYQCIDSEPETIGCRIETEGFYYQTYYDCLKNKVGSDCMEWLLGENKCFAKCFYTKVDYTDFDQAVEECEDECVVDT